MKYQNALGLLSSLAKWIWYSENTTVEAANVPGKGTQHSTGESKTLSLNSKFGGCVLALTPSCLTRHFSV